MKKLITFLFLVATLPSIAQVSLPNGKTSRNDNMFMIDIGLNAGLGVAWLSETKENRKNRLTDQAFSAGLTEQYNFPKYFSLQIGLLFEQKGGGEKDDLIIGTNHGSSHEHVTIYDYVKLDYFTLPVLLRFSMGKQVKYFGNIGFYTAGMAQGVLESSGGFVYDVAKHRRFDAGAVWGFGVATTPTKPVAFTVEFRQDIGMHSVSVLHSHERNNSVEILVGLAFRFSKREY